MRKPRREKTKPSSRRKHVAARKARRHARALEKVRPNQPEPNSDQGEHLRGLWVTLGLADTAD